MSPTDPSATANIRPSVPPLRTLCIRHLNVGEGAGEEKLDAMGFPYVMENIEGHSISVDGGTLMIIRIFEDGGHMVQQVIRMFAPGRWQGYRDHIEFRETPSQILTPGLHIVN
jgi:hypothetical protein